MCIMRRRNYLIYFLTRYLFIFLIILIYTSVLGKLLFITATYFIIKIYKILSLFLDYLKTDFDIKFYNSKMISFN